MARVRLGEDEREDDQQGEDRQGRQEAGGVAEGRIVTHQTDLSCLPKRPSGLIIRTTIISANSTAGVQ